MSNTLLRIFTKLINIPVSLSLKNNGAKMGFLGSFGCLNNLLMDGSLKKRFGG